MRIIELDLYTANLEATREFYTRRLGLSVVSRSDRHVTVQIGWTSLTFRLVDQPVAPYHLAINVPHCLLEEMMDYFGFDYLDTQAPNQPIADFADWRARACYFYESPGSPETSNLLEFIARTDLPLDDPNLTLNEFFQGVSEIGIATEDVAYTTRLLKQRFGINQFSKTCPAPDFNAVGDHNGLFILARSGRNWLFSKTPAQLNYCSVRFTTGQNEPVQEVCSYQINQLPTGQGTQTSILPG